MEKVDNGGLEHCAGFQSSFNLITYMVMENFNNWIIGDGWKHYGDEWLN